MESDGTRAAINLGSATSSEGHPVLEPYCEPHHSAAANASITDVVSQLVRYLPDDVRKTEAVQELAGYGCVTQMHVIRLLAPRLENENHTKDIDFTPSGIRMRREAGFEATMRALRQAPWQGQFDPIEGVILHESMPDLAMAAE